MPCAEDDSDSVKGAFGADARGSASFVGMTSFDLSVGSTVWPKNCRDISYRPRVAVDWVQWVGRAKVAGFVGRLWVKVKCYGM